MTATINVSRANISIHVIIVSPPVFSDWEVYHCVKRRTSLENQVRQTATVTYALRKNKIFHGNIITYLSGFVNTCQKFEYIKYYLNLPKSFVKNIDFNFITCYNKIEKIW